jgi:hypothetical protein
VKKENSNSTLEVWKHTVQYGSQTVYVDPGAIFLIGSFTVVNNELVIYSLGYRGGHTRREERTVKVVFTGQNLDNDDSEYIYLGTVNHHDGLVYHAFVREEKQ